MNRLRELLTSAGVRVKNEYPLSRHTSFRIGGSAALAVFPETREQMLTTLRILTECDAGFVVIGNASNVVFDDNGYRGVVVFTSSWRELTQDGCRIQVSAGVPLLTLANTARDASLSGLEFAYGIPGSVGGAIYMNAGAYGRCMADVCQSSLAFDRCRGETVSFCGEEQCFGYRTSVYEKTDRYVILGADLTLCAGEREEIGAQMNEYLSRRRRTQPLEYPNAGSVFKRPEGYFAGKLIEDCGLKGVSIGGAQVSEKHAGFIVNRGGATASDVRRLVELIQDRVRCETGVTLECEIKFL